MTAFRKSNVEALIGLRKNAFAEVTEGYRIEADFAKKVEAEFGKMIEGLVQGGIRHEQH